MNTTRPQPVLSYLIELVKDRPNILKKSPHVSSPLSVIEGKAHGLLFDIDTFVHRSTEQRSLEMTTAKKPGKIKRPMNAFMLYRKAYQKIALEKCGQINQQMVSKVCGDSWLLEPNHIRVQFKEWAKTDRDSHQKAYPHYRFITSKQQKVKSPRGPGKGQHLERRKDNGPHDSVSHRSSRKRKTENVLGGNENQSTYPRQRGFQHSMTDFRQQQHYNSQDNRKLEPSLLPAGAGKQLAELSDHGGYQHQLEPALIYSSDDSPGQQHLYQTMTFEFEQYAVVDEE